MLRVFGAERATRQTLNHGSELCFLRIPRLEALYFRLDITLTNGRACVLISDGGSQRAEFISGRR